MKKTLESLIKQTKFTWANSDINSKNFPDAELADVEHLELIHFNRTISSDDAIKEMKEKGLRPATARELVAYAIKNPEEQRKYPIVALGQDWQDPHGDRDVLVLGGGAGDRSLHLLWFDGRWHRSYRFAGVRESQTLGTLAPSTASPCEDCKKKDLELLAIKKNWEIYRDKLEKIKEIINA